MRWLVYSTQRISTYWRLGQGNWTTSGIHHTPNYHHSAGEGIAPGDFSIMFVAERYYILYDGSQLRLIRIVVLFIYKYFLQATAERVERNKSSDFEFTLGRDTISQKLSE
jgi:hypothetical protein